MCPFSIERFAHRDRTRWKLRLDQQIKGNRLSICAIFPTDITRTYVCAHVIFALYIEPLVRQTNCNHCRGAEKRKNTSTWHGATVFRVWLLLDRARIGPPTDGVVGITCRFRSSGYSISYRRKIPIRSGFVDKQNFEVTHTHRVRDINFMKCFYESNYF